MGRKRMRNCLSHLVNVEYEEPQLCSLQWRWEGGLLPSSLTQEQEMLPTWFVNSRQKMLVLPLFQLP